MNFLPHLEELRKRLLFCLAVFFAASVLSYFFSTAILDFLTWPLRKYSETPLIFQKPYEAFLLHIKAAAFTGLVLSSPVLLTQLWFFAAPGLYEKEKKMVLPVIAASIGLFLLGILFSYWVIVPWGLQFMLNFQTESLKPMLNATSYFSFLMGMLLAFGILFDFPVLVVGLVEVGAVKTAWLRQSRRVIVVLIFMAAAILTPSPDPVSQLLLALPLWLLFEISLAFAASRESRKQGEADLTP